MRRGSFMLAGIGEHADVDLRQRETRVFGGEDEIAGYGEFKPASDRHAVGPHAITGLLSPGSSCRPPKPPTP